MCIKNVKTRPLAGGARAGHQHPPGPARRGGSPLGLARSGAGVGKKQARSPAGSPKGSPGASPTR